MPDPTPAPVSPTGAPLLPPSIARWVTLAIVSALAVLGALVAIYPDSKGLQVALAVTTALAAVLGIASPGLRRAAVVLLCLAPLTLGACSAKQKAAVEAYFKAVGECSLGSATEQGKDLIAELDGATKRPGGIDWKARGTALGFDVLRCALEALAAVVQNRLELAVARNSMGALPDAEVGALRDQITRINIARMDLAAQ